jgi:DNA-binding response OmpR family regulator
MSEKIKILLLQSDLDYRRVVKKCLLGAGYQIVPTPTTHPISVTDSALEEVALIVSDLRVGKSDIPDLLSILKHQDQAPPILILSGASPDRLKQALLQGAAATLTKPIQLHELLDKVRSLLTPQAS